MSQFGFFDISESYRRIDACGDGDRLLRLDGVIDWSGLSSIMDRVHFRFDENLDPLPRSKEGRPARCGLMMAKILILQAKYNISDERTEFLLHDRLTFRRFVGLTDPSARPPHWTTIRNWRERLTDQNLLDTIFNWFDTYLSTAGFEAKSGQIIDATFVPTHKPTGRQAKQFKEEIPLTPAQARQLDTDATFTKKRNQTHHGYKNHINIDVKYKLIRAYEVTTASVHDSQVIGVLIQPLTASCQVSCQTVSFDNEGVLPKASAPEDTTAAAPSVPAPAVPVVLPSDANVFADSAYRSQAIEALLAGMGLTSQVHERAYRNRPLSDEQKALNREKSRDRVRVEHVFGHMETAMGGMMIHTIGLARAKAKMMFKNLAYNLERFASLVLKNEKASLKTQPNCA